MHVLLPLLAFVLTVLAWFFPKTATIIAGVLFVLILLPVFLTQRLNDLPHAGGSGRTASRYQFWLSNPWVAINVSVGLIRATALWFIMAGIVIYHAGWLWGMVFLVLIPLCFSGAARTNPPASLSYGFGKDYVFERDSVPILIDYSIVLWKDYNTIMEKMWPGEMLEAWVKNRGLKGSEMIYEMHQSLHEQGEWPS
jgi:hypothetical protein